MRAAWTTWRRLLEADLLLELGQSLSMICSRWRRCPGARASSFTTPAGFLRRHCLSSMILEPTETLNPPSSQMRTGSVPSPVGITDRAAPSKPEGGHIPLPSWLSFPAVSCLLSYSISAHDNESPMAWQVGSKRIGANRRQSAYQKRSSVLKSVIRCAVSGDDPWTCVGHGRAVGGPVVAEPLLAPTSSVPSLRR